VTAHMMDDFLLAGDSREEAERKMDVLIKMLESVGFHMAPEKTEYGQQLVFLGVLIDSVNMTLRFESVQAKGMKAQMESYAQQLRRRDDLDHTTIRHVCGKLNWYCEVVQSGRCHTKAWWLYEKHISGLFEENRRELLADTQWWIDLLQTWSENRSRDCEYKIWSASELLDDPHSLYILQSDASGTDGYGYYSGYYSDSELDYKFVSKRWPAHYKLDEMHSHLEELMALEDFLLETQLHDLVLVWISDSESAVWSVNKGRCRDPAAMIVLRNILRVCDAVHIQIIALWVPREENVIADYLSHFAHLTNSGERRGFLRDLGIFTESGAQGRQHQASQAN
jgi:hypothetical protein